MAALFPPWSNTLLRLGVGAIGATVVALVAGLFIFVRTPSRRGQNEPPDQPVQFDHRHHNGDDGIDCRYCHASVETQASAGIPSTELCMGCHNQIWTQSPMLEVVRRSWFSGAPIPWNRVHALPGHVYFDHSIHVTRGIGCSSCHGRVDQMAAVSQVASLTMGFCLDCHRNPEPALRPVEAITSMTWTPPADGGASQRELARAYGTRSITYCSGCHR
jgi:hypothetical protein